ncbi:right-handed parallel beta-helix repeat-containing protein [Candidatus Thiothrix anitrata]|uniref:Right-handed parallel beta-helix repeat-containing protein n=1 Tax=Candidatus Thiothrix anitrata TaxID=2823902 RepID=A0ABX7X6D7_9GAMM|nr:hypothetical protein [Candidatus Thiothrix anitrata]QTR51440.1 hypothetical protein J8380_07835 [Candidatus Thiothrix anitrata]
MGDAITSAQSNIQALRTQAQDLQLKASKAQEYIDQQQTRRDKLLAERDAYVKQNPSAAVLVTPSVAVEPSAAQEPSGCLFAAKSKAKPSAKTAAPPANAAAHPKLMQLNTQIADCDNLIGVWQKRLQEYTSMAEKLTNDANTLEQRGQTPPTNTQTPTTTTPSAVLRRTDIHAPPQNEVLDQGFTADAIHVRRSGQKITGNTIRDSILDTEYGKAQNLVAQAHRDAIQLIPVDQFAGGELENLTIDGNAIHSSGKLQGIFGSDGVFRNLTIRNNVIDTVSDHKITLNGLVGTGNRIENNRDANGQLLPVQLNPIRLGGNLATGNVWILSVSAVDEQQYGYHPIMTGDDGVEHILDARSMPQHRDQANGDVNLRGFPFSEYKQQLRRMTITALLDNDPFLDAAVNAWFLRVAGVLPGSPNVAARLEQTRAAYVTQRDVVISALGAHSNDLQNFFIQALAKWLAQQSK